MVKSSAILSKTVLRCWPAMCVSTANYWADNAALIWPGMSQGSWRGIGNQLHELYPLQACMFRRQMSPNFALTHRAATGHSQLVKMFDRFCQRQQSKARARSADLGLLSLTPCFSKVGNGCKAMPTVLTVSSLRSVL